MKRTPKKPIYTGPERLRQYFEAQAAKHPRMKDRDTLATMANRRGVTKTTIFRIAQGQPTTYELAKGIERDTGIPWYTFPMGRQAFPVEAVKALEAANGR